MFGLIKKEIESSGDRTKLISVKDLKNIVQDVEDIKNTGWYSTKMDDK